MHTERLDTVNLSECVNHLNLSTNVENPAANQVRRVICPVSFRFAQGPRQPLKTLCICTGELCVHLVHQFTKLGTLPLTQSRGFPTPVCASLPQGPPLPVGSSSLMELIAYGERFDGGLAESTKIRKFRIYGLSE